MVLLSIGLPRGPGQGHARDIGIDHELQVGGGVLVGRDLAGHSGVGVHIDGEHVDVHISGDDRTAERDPGRVVIHRVRLLADGVAGLDPVVIDRVLPGGVGGFLVEVERADLDELRRQYPEAFNKPYHPNAGLRLERSLTGKNH